MEDFVFIFFVIALVVVGIIVGSVKNQATNATYDRLARKHRGVLQPGGFFSRPTVQFSRDDARYLVNHVATGGKNKTYFTQVHVFGPLPQMRCEIYPEGMWSTLGKLVGMTDIEIGSFEFDRQYVIKGSTVAMLREVINAQVQVLLSRLRSMLGNNDIYMTINAGSMIMKKRGLFRDFRS
ncbi:MAG: hypothetical protein KDA60_06975 [Planctomycetales bacterium]|nr:hypothetical protein [Planctomycetales bacterium]